MYLPLCWETVSNILFPVLFYQSTAIQLILYHPISIVLSWILIINLFRIFLFLFKAISLRCTWRHQPSYTLYNNIIIMSGCLHSTELRTTAHGSHQEYTLYIVSQKTARSFISTLIQCSAQVFKRAGHQFSKRAFSAPCSMIKKPPTTVISAFY